MQNSGHAEPGPAPICTTRIWSLPYFSLEIEVTSASVQLDLSLVRMCTSSRTCRARSRPYLHRKNLIVSVFVPREFGHVRICNTIIWLFSYSYHEVPFPVSFLLMQNVYAFYTNLSHTMCQFGWFQKVNSPTKPSTCCFE
jgi:hypothetical protein